MSITPVDLEHKGSFQVWLPPFLLTSSIPAPSCAMMRKRGVPSIAPQQKPHNPHILEARSPKWQCHSLSRAKASLLDLEISSLRVLTWQSSEGLRPDVLMVTPVRLNPGLPYCLPMSSWPPLLCPMSKDSLSQGSAFRTVTCRQCHNSVPTLTLWGLLPAPVSPLDRGLPWSPAHPDLRGILGTQLGHKAWWPLACLLIRAVGKT